MNQISLKYVFKNFKMIARNGHFGVKQGKDVRHDRFQERNTLQDLSE